MLQKIKQIIESGELGELRLFRTCFGFPLRAQTDFRYNKILGGGILNSDIRGIAGLPVGYEDLMRLAIDYSDAIVLASENINQRLLNYAQNSGKPIMPYVGEDKQSYLDFYNSLSEKNEE